MLDQTLVALASAAGAAVASAAGTDAWQGFRQRVARVFGRPEGTEARVLLERLDRAAAELESAEPDEIEQVRARVVAAWQTRFHDILEDVGAAGRVEVVQHLSESVRHAHQLVPGVSVGDGGLAIEGTVDIRADRGSAAAGVMGDVTIGNPL
ncbi:hypothetical protein [Streptomyces sp. NPDC019890]|uniref:hypothetical protein n=1 Tax=Streptomyces sp. NPDC019890 TaxID=3365064 RepID=UPI00384DE3FF